MIWKNIEIFNVEELMQTQQGYSLLRVPKRVHNYISENGKTQNMCAIGVELRFRLKGSSIKIICQAQQNVDFCYIYYGSVQAEWQQSTFAIYDKPTEITIYKPSNQNFINKINTAKNAMFSSEIIRVVFRGAEIKLIDVIGDCEPPQKNDAPTKKYLAYGSSITGLATSFIPQVSYVNLLSDYFKADLYNLGFPGSCLIETQMVDYLASINNFDFATLELGINLITSIEVSEFSKKVNYLIDKLLIQNANKWIFCIDIFTYFNEIACVPYQKLQEFRTVVENKVKQVNSSKLVYINGSTLLAGRGNLCADCVHPDINGHREIADNLIKEISKYL